jgi:superfamily I DNA/RNA helicase
MDIPVQSYFFEQSLESPIAQGRFTLLNLLVDPYDRVAFRAWLGYGSSTARSGPYSRLRTACEEIGIEPRDAVGLIFDGSMALPYSGPFVERYRLLLEERSRLGELSGPDFVAAWLPDDLDGVSELRETSMRIATEGQSLAELRDAVRDAITQPELPAEADFVRVMSLHKSKGLTANTVVVAGCVEGLLPWIDYNAPQAEQDRQLWEQRRLFYVAITRPTEVLVLSGAATYPADEAYQMLLPVRRGRPARTVASRFIGELGPTAPSAVKGRGWLDTL